MKPESTFIKAVHKHLPQEIYREKTNNPYRGGTPDVYYEGPHGKILWVEYKWYPYKLSELQDRWLTRAYTNGVDAWVVLGFTGKKTSGVILKSPATWRTQYKPNMVLEPLALTDIAQEIEDLLTSSFSSQVPSYPFQGYD